MNAEDARKVILEAAPIAIAENGLFKVALVKSARPDLYHKLVALNCDNKNYVSSLVFAMRREGVLPEGGRMQSPALPPSRLDSDSYNGNGHTEEDSRTRIVWTPDEIKALAAKWVELRIELPTESPISLLTEAQKKVFASNQDRIRNFTNFLGNKELTKEIGIQWNQAKERLTKVPEDKVTVMTVEVPKAMSFEEMVAKMDYPTMKALCAAHEAGWQNTTHLLLREIAAKHGATHLPEIKTYVPKCALVEPDKKKLKRVSIIGPFKHQFEEIETKAKAAGLDMDLRWVDKDHSRPNLGYSDFVIITRFTEHRVTESAVHDLGKDRVFRVEGGIDAVVQKLRDINARQ